MPSNNVFELAAVIAIVIFLISRRSGSKPTAFDYATLGFFVLLVIVGLFASDAALATWVQPISHSDAIHARIVDADQLHRSRL